MIYVDFLPETGVVGEHYLNNTTGQVFLYTGSTWVQLQYIGREWTTATTRIDGGTITADSITVNRLIDWRAKYETLSEDYEKLTNDFNNYRENTIADYQSSLAESIYEEIRKTVAEQVIRDIEVEAYKKARAHVLLQFSECSERI